MNSKIEVFRKVDLSHVTYERLARILSKIFTVSKEKD